MSLPGEKAAYRILYSPFSSASDKAEAATKLSDIESIKHTNEESDRRWADRNKRCPHCGQKI